MHLRNVRRLLVAIACVGSIVAAVSAADEAQHTGQPEVAHESVTSTAAVGFRGKDTLYGRIRTIDHKAGIVGVQTEEGVLSLQAVPETIKNWKEGDLVVMEFGGTEWPSGSDAATGGKKPLPFGYGEDIRLSPRN